MEKILADILSELRYQNKLLESLFEKKRADGTNASIETAMNMVLKMPFMKQIGVDPAKLRQAILGVEKKD
jgi:hypothetical protein